MRYTWIVERMGIGHSRTVHTAVTIKWSFPDAAGGSRESISSPSKSIANNKSYGSMQVDGDFMIDTWLMVRTLNGVIDFVIRLDSLEIMY